MPLDWNSTKSDSTRAVLAIIKRPAEVDVTHPSYGGAILFNPGVARTSIASFLADDSQAALVVQAYNSCICMEKLWQLCWTQT